MRIGLFFGSFNPIHFGHLIIADHLVFSKGVEKVWFVVSPQNPFKKPSELASEFDRLDMVRQAVYDNESLEATDIEFGLGRPNYTAVTLAALKEKYPQHTFSLIMGEDNLASLPRWRNVEYILDTYDILAYPRHQKTEATPPELLARQNITLTTAPFLDISASYIRGRIKAGQPIRYLVPPEVERIIASRKLYM